MIRAHPTSTLFPYTTLFRSHRQDHLGEETACVAVAQHRRSREGSFEPQAKARSQPGSRIEDPRFRLDRKSTRLNSSHVEISYAVFCLKKKSSDKPSSYSPRP